MTIALAALPFAFASISAAEVGPGQPLALDLAGDWAVRLDPKDAGDAERWFEAEFSDRIASGASEFYSLIIFALSGMLFAASANHFAMLFVSVELITVTFYVLTSFQRARVASLEAGVKYLVQSAVGSVLVLLGMALVLALTGTMNLAEIRAAAGRADALPLLAAGALSLLWFSRLP